MMISDFNAPTMSNTGIIEDQKMKQLFDLCESNEGIQGRVHIIDNGSGFEEEREYRVYHADGYCFDIKKEIVDDEESEGVIDGYVYEYFDGYEGFGILPVKLAIELIEKELSKHKA